MHNYAILDFLHTTEQGIREDAL